jgi:hypothetical protein
MKQTRTQGMKLSGIGFPPPIPEKMSGKLRYLRKFILNLLCITHWIIGAMTPSRKKKTMPW